MNRLVDIGGSALARETGGELCLRRGDAEFRFPPGPAELVLVDHDAAAFVLAGGLRAGDSTRAVEVEHDSRKVLTRVAEGGWLSEPFAAAAGGRVSIRWLSGDGAELRSFALPPIDATMHRRDPITFAPLDAEEHAGAPVGSLSPVLEAGGVAVTCDDVTGCLWLVSGRRPPLRITEGGTQVVPVGGRAEALAYAGLVGAAVWLLVLDRESLTSGGRVEATLRVARVP